MIYLCIPTHDEETTVGVVLWKVRQVMADLGRDYQLLVADDASTDRTPRVLEPYTRVLPLTVLRTERRRGYATSIEMLLREASRRSAYPKRDVAVVLQADFTHDPDHIPNLVKRIESGADIAVSNAIPPSIATWRQRWGQKALNWLLTPLGWPDEVDDPLTGFNAYRLYCVRKAIQQAGSERLLRESGEIANAELLRATVPHARRVDAVEFLPHPERRQRPSRTRLRSRLRAALAYRRGKGPPAPLPLDSLTPDSVIGLAHGQRSLVVESLRDGSNGNGVEPGTRRRRSTSGRKRRRPSQGSSGDRRPSKRSKSDAEAEAARDRAEKEPARRRKRRRKRRTADQSSEASSPANAGSDGGRAAGRPSADGTDDADSGSNSEQAGSTRRKRGRRGGRRRRGSRSGPRAGAGDQSGGSDAGQASE